MILVGFSAHKVTGELLRKIEIRRVGWASVHHCKNKPKVALHHYLHYLNCNYNVKCNYSVITIAKCNQDCGSLSLMMIECNSLPMSYLVTAHSAILLFDSKYWASCPCLSKEKYAPFSSGMPILFPLVAQLHSLNCCGDPSWE